MTGSRWLVPALTAALVVGLSGSAAATPGGSAAGRSTTHLRWHTCQQGSDDEDGRALDQAGGQCADLSVPLDYRYPRGRTLTLAVSRLRAPDRTHRAGVLAVNIGGPGLPVLGRLVDARAALGSTGDRFDLIGVDTRFTGRSSPLDCGWPGSWLSRSAGADRASFDRTTRVSRRLAADCTRRYRALLPYASTANAARDLDAVRAALGPTRLNYLGYSYGTYLGAVYTQLFPERAGRMVLDSAIDPGDPGPHERGVLAPAREAALRDWARWAAARNGQLHLGATAADVLAVVTRVYRASARQPLRVGRYAVDDTLVPALLLDPLSDDTGPSRRQLASVVTVLARALRGPTTPTPALAAALEDFTTGAGSSFHSGQTALLCGDAAVPRDPGSYWRRLQAARAHAPLFAGVDSLVPPCAFWPAPTAAIRVANQTPALISYADGDINTTEELDLAMHRALPRSRLVVARSVRAHGLYLFRGDACVDRAVNAYLDSGVLPAADVEC